MSSRTPGTWSARFRVDARPHDRKKTLMAVHELYLLYLGRVYFDPANADNAWGQVPGYLIHTASGRYILVDTGNPLIPGGATWEQRGDDVFIETQPEDDIVPRLAELGLQPKDIDLLVSSHFDFDHCGRHDVFALAGTESVVQRRHLEAARAEPERFDPALWDLPGLRYIPLDGDTELEPGLRLLETSGHAIGHQSVYVETPDGPVILAIDAIGRRREALLRRVPEWSSDGHAALASLERLLRLAEETDAYLVYGHEQRQWQALPHSPAPFRRPTGETSG
ncbi:MAG: hypothetical protein C4346_19420 [Chloroflexota bacterium]